MTVGGLIWVLVTTLMGWIAKEQWNMVQATQKDLNNHKEDVARTYVPKSDYKSDINRVFELLDRINDKLDGKADRHSSQGH